MPSRERNSWKIEDAPWNSILRHAVGEYPEEACGILLCPCERPDHITEAQPTRNATSGNLATRYLVDPQEFLKVLNWAEQRELDICGFYHSHPDHPPLPSEYDRKSAWEGYLYLILSIKDGVFEKASAWRLDPEEKLFKEVTL